MRKTFPSPPRVPARRPWRLPALRLACAVTALACTSALAQDYGAMVRQHMQEMNRIVGNAEQQGNAIVAQRMRDPQVQAAYRQHVAQAQAAGRQPYDFPTFTYYWVYTNGFSAQGMAQARANEAGIQARERAAVQDLRDAEAGRGAAQQAQRDAYFARQQEAGRQLLGNSTFTAGNGAQVVLPHTWQAGTLHEHQGSTYYVDPGGRYWVRDAGGYWLPLHR